MIACREVMRVLFVQALGHASAHRRGGHCRRKRGWQVANVARVRAAEGRERFVGVV